MKMLALELSTAVGSVAFLRRRCDAASFGSFPADRKDSGLFYENLEAIYQRGLPRQI